MRGSYNIPGIRRQIGHYSYMLKDVIGKGCSSVVYRGCDHSTGETIALKLINMKNIKQEIDRTLLTNEIEVLKALTNQQNIIRLHEVIPLHSHMCIVTELCDGGDLAQLIKQQKHLSEARATKLLEQIINGYRGIYQHGIVHRDLKPANIFLKAKDIKIADFGFSMKGPEPLQYSNYNVGSPAYMPLEALNNSLYSAKSDVWAIGVIFYEMLTGKKPWRAKTDDGLIRQINAISINSILPVGISKNASAFLLKALQLNPETRMTPEEMFVFFQQAKENQLTEPQPSASAQRTNTLFRTRAISRDHEERPNFNTTSKNKTTAPKSFRRISKLIDSKSSKRRSEKIGDQVEKDAIKQKMHNSERENQFVMQRLGDPKLGHLARTVARMGEWVPDPKKTSSQLLSQIHFCCFLFKLLQRMATIGEDFTSLREQMRALLAGKLSDVKHLRLIAPRHATLFRRTREFQHIEQIVDQYTLKYSRVLAQPAVAYEDALAGIDGELGVEIGKLYLEITERTDEENRDGRIVLLDYLFTLKQLLQINANKDIEYFHQKSQIQAILKGRPAKSITDQHFHAIVHRLKVFKMIA